MANEEELLTCYNRGCGKKFDPNANPNDACRYHSGAPFFHDAYKGWSCCKKKCTDFTEFLNIPGCTFSKHSNEKPPELPKPIKESNPAEVIEVKPIVAPTLKRPPFTTPMVTMTPVLAPALKQQKEITPVKVANDSIQSDDDNVIAIGTSCQNGGCNKSFQGPESNSETCIYHPGYPVFHEGLKFWSCCQKRTSDFNAFLNQEGCERGVHLWRKEENDKRSVECRWDWHQTGNFIVLAVYAKQYCPNKSTVQVNPIRVLVNLVFPHEDNTFTLDFELFGVIDVTQSEVSMFGTKVEIKLRKAELRSWAKLHIPHSVVESNTKEKEIAEKKIDETLAPQIDAVDLSDL